MPNVVLSDLHRNENEFRQALEYTAAQESFTTALIEKDYYCSLILAQLYQTKRTPLVFRGGTCLSKVHIGFYRLSEDLDFLIPISHNASKKQRSSLMNPVKKHLTDICKHTTGVFEIEKDVEGANQSRQYTAELSYNMNGGGRATIRIDIGLREDCLQGSCRSYAQTLLTDPLSAAQALAPIPVQTLTLQEAYAEKMRAALTRREPAIRDYFDLDFAIRTKKLDLRNETYRDLVRKKLAIPGAGGEIDVTGLRLKALKIQLESELKPVLRDKDYNAFDFDHACKSIAQFAGSI